MTLVWRAVPKVVILGFVVLAATLLYWPLQALFVHVPLSYNEGWNAFHSLRLRTGGPLYPPIAPDTFINYPPLSFYIVGALARLIGDDIIAGRVVALLALLVTTLNVGIAARRLGATRDIAIIAALAVFCFAAIYFTDYVGVNDPQWQVQALQSTGLVILLGKRRDWRPLLAAAVLMVLGGLVKHSGLILPLSATLWLVVEDRAALRRWLVALGGSGVVAIAVCLGLFGHDFLDQVIGLGRTSTAAVLLVVAATVGPHLAPFVAAAAIGAWLRRRTAEGRFIALYLVVAILGAAVLMTGSGVIYNTLFDLVIAMMLGCALLCQAIVERYRGDQRSTAVAAALVSVLFALRFLMIAPNATAGYAPVISDLGRQPAWAASIERVRASPGPVACETLALCYWAGRRSEIEFFNFGQRAQLDPGYDAAFRTMVETGAISLIQLDTDVSAHRLSPELETLIAGRYTRIQQSPTILMVPR